MLKSGHQEPAECTQAAGTASNVMLSDCSDVALPNPLSLQYLPHVHDNTNPDNGLLVVNADRCLQMQSLPSSDRLRLILTMSPNIENCGPCLCMTFHFRRLRCLAFLRALCSSMSATYPRNTSLCGPWSQIFKHFSSYLATPFRKRSPCTLV
jgi:hypothetical protein